jgi:hypothetical protein
MVDMREATGKPGPAVYFCAQVRQLSPWQEIIGAFSPFLRTVFRHGELRQQYREDQEDQLGPFSLVVNIIYFVEHPLHQGRFGSAYRRRLFHPARRPGEAFPARFRAHWPILPETCRHRHLQNSRDLNPVLRSIYPTPE